MRLTKSSDFMLMDALREKDELSVRASELPRLDGKLVKLSGGENYQISALAVQLYNLEFGSLTVAQILDALPATDAKISTALMELRGHGLLSW